jgi:hypothetical protein
VGLLEGLFKSKTFLTEIIKKLIRMNPEHEMPTLGDKGGRTNSDHDFQSNEKLAKESQHSPEFGNSSKKNSPERDYEKYAVPFEPSSQKMEFKVQMTDPNTSEPCKVIEALLSSMSGVFIVFKSQAHSKFKKDICTVAVIYEWNLTNPKLDDRGKEKFLIQCQKGLKNKKTGLMKKSQYIIKSCDTEETLCYIFKSKKAYGLYLPKTPKENITHSQEVESPMDYTEEERTSKILGSFRDFHYYQPVVFFRGNEKKEQIGLLKDTYYRFHEETGCEGVSFESGVLGLFDGQGKYQCVEFPPSMLWDERLLLMVGTWKKAVMLSEEPEQGG